MGPGSTVCAVNGCNVALRFSSDQCSLTCPEDAPIVAAMPQYCAPQWQHIRIVCAIMAATISVSFKAFPTFSACAHTVSYDADAILSDMSNALTTLVPLLDGTNYREWSKAMQAYLMSMDLWEYANGDESEPTLPANPSAEQRAAHKAWKSSNQKALANLVLRVAPIIRVDLDALNTADTVWNRLKLYFDVVQPTTVFKDFKDAISIRIDATKHPLPQINCLQASVHRLTTNGVAIPEIIQVMILLSALPPKWEMLVSILCTNYEITNLQLKHVREAVMAQWEAKKSKGKHTPHPPQNAHKLSAVKRKRGEPNYKQQRGAGSGGGNNAGHNNSPQQSGQGNSQGKKKRGKRAGKWAQQQTQDDHTHDHSHLTSQVAMPPPSSNTIAHFAPGGKTVRTVPGHTTFAPATKGMFPKFNKARTIVRDIGVEGTANILRTLEERIAPLSLDDFDDDQPTNKRTKSSPEPSNGGTSDETISRCSISPVPQDETIEDCVSLGENDWDLDAMVSDAAGLFDEESVAFPFTIAHNADLRTPSQLATKLRSYDVQSCVKDEIESAFNCAYGSDITKCAKCKDQSSATGSVRWLLDSGASSHFTHSLQDFIEYEDIKQPICVQTASRPIHIKGKGAVLITHTIRHKGHDRKRTTRLYPVFYIPEITGRLLSVGEFLQQGLRVYGDTRAMILRRENSTVPLIQCMPAKPGHTIYWLETVITDMKAHATIYSVDYHLMHRRLGHPSKDVLRHARSKTKGFPQELDFPSEAPVCPGCAQGKMSSLAHLPSDLRASTPFEKVHSDLKSFPVESYHKYKYFISFLDDYTSYAWVVCLRTKSGAIGALKQYTALVKNQFDTTIKEWMSDAGGEYKSDVFLNTLKDQGIRILQSAPYTPKQNGRAERFMHTCMDKAQAMRLEACLPESWWEFAVLHAVHVYNRTPVRRLQWRTPYEALHGVTPDVSHLQVFGCGAYVHIPENQRENKLAPKSELMVYIGHTEGVKAFTFLRLSKGTVYTGVTAMFDEAHFPKCSTSKKHGLTCLQEPAEQHGTPPQPTPFVDEDEDARRPPPPSRPPSRTPQVPQDPDEDPAPPPERTSPSPAPESEPEPEREPLPPPPPPLRRSERDRRIPSRPGNVYGEDRHPVQQYRDVQRLRQWQEIVSERRGRSLPPTAPRQRQVPGPSNGQPQRESDTPLPPSRGSVDEVEDLLTAQLAQEGGVELV